MFEMEPKLHQYRMKGLVFWLGFVFVFVTGFVFVFQFVMESHFE